MLDPSLADEVIKTIAKLFAAAGGGAAIAWFFISKFGDRWLEQKFAKRLEQFKHEKTQEIEQLRHQIASLFSRISKIHEKEFEILPIAFLKLHQAYGSCSDISSGYLRFPNLSAMNAEHFAEFVVTCRLPDFRKQELLPLRSGDRDDYYRRWIFWVDLSETQTMQRDFHNFLVMNRLFMTDHLRQRFLEIDRLISSVLSALEFDRQAPGSTLLHEARSDLAKIEPLLSPLEKEIQKRLRYEEA